MKIYAQLNFAETRMKKGYSLIELSKEIGITQQGLGKFEKRLNGISPKKSQEILRLFDVDFDDIFELVERD